jgi:predicted phage terminase large subunit-like protein
LPTSALETEPNAVLDLTVEQVYEDDELQRPTDLSVEATRIELELTQRELARRKLVHFVERMTDDFVPGWHVDEICAALEQLEIQVAQGKGTDARLIVEAPPRHTKSQTISRCFPLWYLARHPKHEVIVATYNQDLADDLGRWAKRIAKDPAFTAVFPKFALRSDSQASNRLDTPQGGGIRYVGVGGSLTGRGGHILIVDDPIKGAEDADSEVQSEALWSWYTAVLRTRLAPGGAIAVLHTRWRTNDLIGRLLEAQRSGGDQWRRLTFAALAKADDPWGRAHDEPLQPARFSRQDLEALRDSMIAAGKARDWLSMYQQEPMNPEGNLFKVSDFNLYEPGKLPKGLIWYLATDLAVSTKSSADPTCLWPFGIDADGCFWFSPYFIHERIPTNETIDAIIRVATEYDVHGIIIEGGVIFRSIEPELKRRMRKARKFFNLLNPVPVKDKLTRSRPLHARMASSMAKFPNTRHTGELVIPQFIQFTGKGDEHDDIVDTCAWPALIADQLLAPHGDDKAPTNQDDDEDGPEGSMAWIEARSQPEAPARNRHSPPTLTGQERKRGNQYRYA